MRTPFAILLFTSAAFSQTNAPATGLKQPVLVTKVEAEYTAEARAKQIEGAVVLHADVNQEGYAVNVRIVRSLDPGLDANAVEALKKWRFQPATKNGEPVTVSATLEFNFRFPRLPEFKRPDPPLQPDFVLEPLSIFIPRF